MAWIRRRIFPAAVHIIGDTARLAFSYVSLCGGVRLACFSCGALWPPASI